MERGAKSKDFIHPRGLADRPICRNKALRCHWKFSPTTSAGGRSPALSGISIALGCAGRGMAGEAGNRGNRIAIMAAARDDLSGVERQFEVAVLAGLEPADARQIDQAGGGVPAQY